MAKSTDNFWLRAALLYGSGVLLLGGYFNFIHYYSGEPVTAPGFWPIFLWITLYVPVLVLPLVAARDTARPWQVTEFGFTLNARMALAAAVGALLMGLMTWGRALPWTSAWWEAFARTGEEVFFRGFLLALFTRLFAQRRKPVRDALLLSAFLFALVHTQTFRPEFREWYSSPEMPLAYRIIERMLNLFLTGLVWGGLCLWTRSILPSAIIHSALNARSLPSLPFVLLLYGGLTFWAYRRGEPIYR